MKLLLIDKDQTLVESTNPNGFVNKAEEQVIKKGADDLIKDYLFRDYLIYVVSNRGGIAKGCKTLVDACDEMIYCNNLFPAIKAFLFCPDQWQSKGDICWLWDVNHPHLVKHNRDRFSVYGYRKPNPGMLLLAHDLASENNNCHFDEIVMIGDRDTDMQAAEAASVVLKRKIVYKDINTLI